MEIFSLIFIETLGLGQCRVGARSSELLVEFTEVGNLEPRPPPNQVCGLAWPETWRVGGKPTLKANSPPFPPIAEVWLPGGREGKASACNVGDLGSIPALGRSPEEGNGNPLQYSCLENSMDGGAW